MIPDQEIRRIARGLGVEPRIIARDLYDIHTLSGRDLDIDAVQEALPAKVAARDVDTGDVSAERMVSRREEFEDDWHRNLIPLVPEAEELDFDHVWEETAIFVQRFTPIEPGRTRSGEGD